MNGVRVKKSEQKLLDEIKSGILASKMMNIPANDQIFQTDGEVSKAKKGKKDAKHSPPEDKIDYKDLDKLVEQLKPKELRKLIMAYIEAVSSLPEDAARRSVNIAAVTANINTDKDSEFFEDFFVSLGQNCKKAEKAIKTDTKAEPEEPRFETVKKKTESRYRCCFPECHFILNKTQMKEGLKHKHLTKFHKLKPRDMKNKPAGTFNFPKLL